MRQFAPPPPRWQRFSTSRRAMAVKCSSMNTRSASVHILRSRSTIAASVLVFSLPHRLRNRRGLDGHDWDELLLLVFAQRLAQVAYQLAHHPDLALGPQPV